MLPLYFLVTVPDAHLGLAVDEILAVAPGAGVEVRWPRRRPIAPNYGYLAGLLAGGALTPVRGRQLLRRLNAAPAPAQRPAAPPRRIARSTT